MLLLPLKADALSQHVEEERKLGEIGGLYNTGCRTKKIYSAGEWRCEVQMIK